MKELLFSYGTLQLEKVQLDTFGRKLKGTVDILKTFALGQLQITDKTVLSKSKQEFHPIAIFRGNEQDKIEGVLFEVSLEELLQADSYEVSDYKRIKVRFDSGREGWVYVKA